MTGNMLVSRVSKRPKSYLADTGIAAYLVGADPERLAEPTAVATGRLVETFTANETWTMHGSCAPWCCTPDRKP